MKTARNTKARRKIVRRSPPLSLSARIERLEKTLLFKAPKATKAVSQRFTKLSAAVHDAKTGLIWSAGPLLGGKDLNHADAMKACAALELLGKKDWRAPTIEELLSIVDYTRIEPAVDTDYFEGPYGWTWSSTLASAPAGYAWGVFLHDGGSYRHEQTYPLPVRAVRAGQQLGLLG